MALYKDSLVLKRELGDKRGIASTLGIPPYAAGRLRLERNLDSTKKQLPADEWARIWAEGEAMTLDEAVNFALREKEPAVSS